MPREPLPAEIEELESLLRESRFLDAHRRLADFAPPEAWTSSRGRIVAGRVVANVGGNARGRRLHLSTWRRDPSDPEARYFALLDYQERHGSVDTLRLL